MRVLAQLVYEVVDGCGGQVLVFCNTRKRCEAVAQRPAAYRRATAGSTDNPSTPGMPQPDVAVENRHLRSTLPWVCCLCCLCCGAMHCELPPLLSVGCARLACHSQGIVFHHATLSEVDQRSVEHLFKERAVSVLVATSTLAAGAAAVSVLM